MSTWSQAVKSPTSAVRSKCKRHLHSHGIRGGSSYRSASTHETPTIKWTADQQTYTRSLLRALLREATYLPDGHARLYISSRIVSRFRDYTPPNKATSLLDDRRDEQVKEARKHLSELRRANLGDVKAMTKLLHLTYGRTGKRRHEMLAPLLEPDIVERAAETTPQHPSTTINNDSTNNNITINTNNNSNTNNDTGNNTNNKPNWQDLTRLPSKLKALVISQTRTQPASPTRPNTRHLKPQIPATNVWERPMPQKRVKNMTKDWYAQLLQRTLPPLPTALWEDLKLRALGRLPLECLVERRRTLKPVASQDHQNSDADRTRVLEREIGVADLTSVDAVLERVDDKARPRTVDTRFMRRRWSAIFAQSAKMVWLADKNVWEITWGHDVLLDDAKMRASHTAATSPPSASRSSSVPLSTSPARSSPKSSSPAWSSPSSSASSASQSASSVAHPRTKQPRHKRQG